MEKLTILGSTGSIGVNALSVVEANSERFKVEALVAGSNVSLMIKQCLRFNPSLVCMAKEESAIKVRNALNDRNIKVEVLSGEKYACELASLSNVDQVISAISGIAGLLPTLAAIRSGKRVLLANKELLVICGNLFLETIKTSRAIVLPLDSEHSAIFQSLSSFLQKKVLSGDCISETDINSIILTGSGGPFFNFPVSKLKYVTPQQACKHPNWLMGRKISVDSATMMNKGLEYIEAYWFFKTLSTQIEIIIHPQSIIHSMICYCDGSVLAQLGIPDMKIYIAYALSWPKRIPSNTKPLDLTNVSKLTFYKPDYLRYPCLRLAIEACKLGQTAVITLNAANEIAVTAFLDGKIRFTDIALLNELVLTKLQSSEPKNIDDILTIDYLARNLAYSMLHCFN